MPKFNCNSHLPYSTENDLLYYRDIQKRLKLSFLSGDAKTVLSYTKKLKSLLNLKFSISDEDRKSLIHMYYNIITTQTLGASYYESFCSISVVLLKGNKKKLENFFLDWKPLYLLIKKMSQPKLRDRNLPGTLRGVSFVSSFTKSVKNYFSPESTKEILEEFLPQINITSRSNISIQSWLLFFLSTKSPPPPLERLEDCNAPPFYWVPTLFSLWSLVGNSRVYDPNFFNIFAKLASDQMTTPENVCWTEDQVKVIFTAGMKALKVPVSGANIGISHSFSGFASKSQAENLAIFVVSTIYPTPKVVGDPKHPNLNSLKHLREMIRSLETYFHPSNHGSWTKPLTFFIETLSSEMLKRIYFESDENKENNNHFSPILKLTKEIKKEFVLMLKGVAFFAMYSKDSSAVSSAQKTLKNLSWIEPTLIFPELLDNVYISLQTLTETHRTLSSIGVLSVCAQPLISRKNFPEGAIHIPQLLNLVLPGIDINDPRKTYATFDFLNSVFMFIPVHDLSSLSTTTSGDKDAMEVVKEGVEKLSLFEENYNLKMSTGFFEEFLVAFLERIFKLVENLPQQYGTSTTHSAESSILSMALYTSHSLFQQLSPTMLNLAIKKFERYVTENITPNATKSIARLVSNLHGLYPDFAIKTFIPLCAEKIKTEILNGASSTPSTSLNSSSKSSTYPYGFASLSDSTFHWFQAILYSVCTQCDGKIFLDNKIRSTLTEAISITLESKSFRGYKWGSRLLKEVIMSLGKVYLLDTASFDREQFKNKDFMAESHMHWGTPPNRPLNLQWHVPSNDEIIFAIELIDLYSKLCLKNLDSLIEISQQKKEFCNEYCKWLTILNGVIGGINAISAESPDEFDMKRDKMKNELPNETPIFFNVGLPLSGTDSNSKIVREIRMDIGKALIKIGNFFAEKRDSDVESIQTLTKCIKNYGILYGSSGVKPDLIADIEKGYVNQKNSARIFGKLSKHTNNKIAKNSYDLLPRKILAKRVFLQHYLRLQENIRKQYFRKQTCEIINDLVKVLLRFSINNSFAEVRKSSQSCLSLFCKYHETLIENVIFPTVLSSLKVRDDHTSDKMKGALYILQRSSLIHFGLRNWNNVLLFVKTLLTAQHEDKPSVQNRVRKLLSEYMSKYTEIVVKFTAEGFDKSFPLFDKDVNVLDNTFKSNLEEMTSSVNADFEKNTACYSELITFLISHLDNQYLHWYYRVATLTCLELCLQDNYAIPSRLVKSSIAGSLSDLKAVRKISTALLVRIMLYIKNRSLKGKYSPLLNIKGIRDFSLVIGQEDGKKEYTRKFALSTKTELYSREEWNNMIFVDDANFGWYCFPKSAKMYFPAENLEEPYPEPMSSEAIQELRESFSKDEFWEAFFKFASQEGEKEIEQLSMDLIKFYKSIFQLFQDSFIELIIPYIDKYIGAVLEKNYQRCCCEILCGIVLGTKNWSYEKLKKLWDWIIPFFQRALLNCSPEMLSYWEFSLTLICRKRDIRRLQPLIKLVLSSSALDTDSHSFFTEARKLSLVKVLISTLNWRFTDVCTDIFTTYMKHVQHPYQLVRNNLGSSLNACGQVWWHPSAQDFYEILRYNLFNRSGGFAKIPLELTQDLPGDVPLLLDDNRRNDMETLVRNLENWRNTSKSGDRRSTEYANAGKTVLIWFQNAINNQQTSGLYPYIKYLLPIIPQLQEFDDQDLQALAGVILKSYPHFPHTPRLLNQVIDDLIKLVMSTDCGWRAKVNILPMIQILFFFNLPNLNQASENLVMETMSELLNNAQVEVRNLAAVTLSGLIQCSQRNSIEKILKEFRNKLKTFPNIRKRRKTEKKEDDVKVTSELIVQKHSLILGLSSIVMAFPYTIPQWMPELLVELALSISDPSPISVTIKNMFSEFKRTHQDTWHNDVLLFNDDQLLVLNDLLISPSYYV